ncbi:MAG: hypothetical protein Q7S44_02490 [bacterium]|nr:hypothetical protein [bacterium]
MAGESREGLQDLSPFNPGMSLNKVTDGSHAEVFEARKSESLSPTPDFYIKMGMVENFPLPILKMLRLVVPRKLASNFLARVLGPEFKIYPDQEFIKNGVAEYLLIRKYFSGSEQNSLADYPVKEYEKNFQGKVTLYPEGESPVRAEVLKSLKDPADPFHQELLKVLGSEETITCIAGVFQRHEDDSFLKGEGAIIGHPLKLTWERAEELKAQGKRLPSTYYIIQKPVTGEGIVPLEKLNDDQMQQHPEVVEKLLVFALLAKKMYFDTGRLIDTRPEEVARHPWEWFKKTANVLVDTNSGGVFFIDTRWLWNKDSRLVGRKGLRLIDILGQRSIDRALKKYTHLLEKKVKT